MEGPFIDANAPRAAKEDAGISFKAKNGIPGGYRRAVDLEHGGYYQNRQKDRKQCPGATIKMEERRV